jgi:hypothetical protein
MKIIILVTLLLVSINAKYLDSKSCAECHEMIHYEHTNSMHHKSSLFKDEFHRKIKELTTPNKYSCALCHVPAATNLRAIMDGTEQPDSRSKKQDDGVSCFYCHQITKVLITKHRNINFYSYKENTKPKFFGNLNNVDSSDKHKSSSSNEIYRNSQVCMGCHGKKYNKHGVQICSAVDEKGATSDCIACHMPKYPGGTTKLNKRGREEYTSHEFLGIRSDEMVKKAVELKLKLSGSNSVELSIKNKMGHDIIMQPMRLKFVETTLKRSGNIIWKNYDKYPIEDEDATFTRLFKDDKNNRVFPPFATGIRFDNNLKANSTKKIIYKLPELIKGDIVKSQWISFVIRPSLSSSLKIIDKEMTKKYIGVEVKLEVK